MSLGLKYIKLMACLLAGAILWVLSLGTLDFLLQKLDPETYQTWTTKNVLNQPAIMFALILLVALPFGLNWAFNMDLKSSDKRSKRILLASLTGLLMLYFFATVSVLPFLVALLPKFGLLLPPVLAVPTSIVWILITGILGVWIAQKILLKIQSRLKA